MEMSLGPSVLNQCQQLLFQAWPPLSSMLLVGRSAEGRYKEMLVRRLAWRLKAARGSVMRAVKLDKAERWRKAQGWVAGFLLLLAASLISIRAPHGHPPQIAVIGFFVGFIGLAACGLYIRPAGLTEYLGGASISAETCTDSGAAEDVRRLGFPPKTGRNAGRR